MSKNTYCIVALFFSFIIAIFSQGVKAQTVFKGQIKSIQGEVLPGASVQVSDTYIATVSNESGYFILENLIEGNYQISIRFIGYKPILEEITIPSKSVKVFVLQNESFLSDEIQVRASRFGDNLTGSSQIVEKTDVEIRNTGQDIPSLISLTPSMVVSSDAGNGIGYSSFRIRGTDMNRINITMNGIPLNDPESHGVWWVNMPDFASSIDNVQITRGVGASTNGAAAFGASLNFLTTSPELKPSLRVESSFGSFNTFRKSLSMESGLLQGKFTFGLRLSDISSDGYVDRSGSQLNSLFLNLAFLREKSIFRINYLTGKEKTGQAWDGIPTEILSSNRKYNGLGMYTNADGEVQYYPNQTDNYRQDHFHFSGSHQFSKALNANFAFHFTHGNGYFEQFKQADKFSNYGLEPVFVGNDSIIEYVMGIGSDYYEDGVINRTDIIRRKYLNNDYLGITFSGQYLKNKNQLIVGGSLGYYEGNHFGKVIWAGFGNNSSLNHEWYRSQGIKKDLNLFSKWNYQINNRINYFADFQSRIIDYEITGIDDDFRNISQQHDFIFFNPKTGFNLNLSRNSLFWLFTGLSHREPNRDNFTDSDPLKPKPKAEQLIDIEFGVKQSIQNLTIDFNVFFMEYKDQLILTGLINDVGAPVMENVSSSYRRGIECSVAWLVFSSVKWQTNINVSRNGINDFTEFVDNWDTWSQDTNYIGKTTLAFSPSITANSIIEWKPFKGTQVIFESQYVGNQYIDNTKSNDRMLNPWIVTNLRMNYLISGKSFPDVRIQLAVLNMLNHEYESNAWVYRYNEGGINKKMDGFFPQAGIHFLARLVLDI